MPPIESPSIDELSDAWNNLRNAAMGRGGAPNVSPALARRVEREYARWRNWRRDVGPIDDMFSSWSTRRWVARYRDLMAKVDREGKGPEARLAMTPMEAAAVQMDRGAVNLAIGAGVAAVTVIAIMLGKGKRGNGGSA